MKKCLGKTKMTGNKNDNGVLEIGTDEIRKSYSEDTPGQNVESFIKEQEKAFHESKDRQKKHFSQVFGNPLQGYPHNEEFEVKEIKEDTQLDEVSDKEIQAMRKVSKDMQKVLVSYQKIANMGDKELKNTKHNYDYEQILKARDTIVSMIGKLQTKQTIEKSYRKEEKQEVFENEAGLKKKAEKSGISLGILKQVYNRGLAAYKTGHRPGATAPQWAMARVNSFITKGKGTWGKADSDLAAKVKGSK